MAEATYATFKTSLGDIVVKLLPEKAPKTVENFVGLAEGTKEWKDPRSGQTVKKPLYDGTMFHRVIPQFMIQGGDPLGNGTGGPGYKFADEIGPDNKFTKPGLLAMANSGPNTNGSQFFITEVPTPRLDRGHTIFGEVVKGFEHRPEDRRRRKLEGEAGEGRHHPRRAAVARPHPKETPAPAPASKPRRARSPHVQPEEAHGVPRRIRRHRRTARTSASPRSSTACSASTSPSSRRARRRRAPASSGSGTARGRSSRSSTRPACTARRGRSTGAWSRWRSRRCRRWTRCSSSSRPGPGPEGRVEVGEATRWAIAEVARSGKPADPRREQDGPRAAARRSCPVIDAYRGAARLGGDRAVLGAERRERGRAARGPRAPRARSRRRRSSPPTCSPTRRSARSRRSTSASR